MPAKNTKSSKAKSNVARSKGKAGLLSKKVKFNWKIAAVIGIVVAAALGYLFVRLSEAGNSRVFGPAQWSYSGDNLAGEVVNKNDGTQAIASIARDGSEKISLKTFTKGVYNGKTSYCFQYATSGPATISSWAYVNNSTKFGFYERVAGATNGKVTKCFDLEARDAYSAKTIYFVIDAAAGQKAYFYSMREQLESTTSTTTGAKTPPQSYPAPAPNNACSGVYGQGNQGDCVVLIQTKLKQLGYDPGPIDGIYGTKTTSAVKLFQSRAGLTQDGVVGPQTWSALFSTSCGQPAAKC